MIAVRGKEYTCGNDGSGQRATPSFIGTGNAGESPGAQSALKPEVIVRFRDDIG